MTNSIGQAIITAYSERVVPDSRGKRPTDMTITARCTSGEIVVPVAPAPENLLHQTAAWRYEEHERAARALLEKMGWHGRDLVGGMMPGGGYVFVQVERAEVKLTKLTAETITDDQIRQLRVEALACVPADDRQRAICDLALGYAVAYDYTSGAAVLVDMEQAAARARCADAINAARRAEVE